MNDSAYTLVSPDSAVLNLVAEAVPLTEINAKENQDLIERMFVVARGKQGDPKYPTLVGLAAPQIGVSKRVIIIGVDAAGDGKKPVLRVFINPEIIEQSNETEEGREGCFSTGRVCGVVNRAKTVKLRAYDEKGNVFECELTGFPARVAHHEIDHLDGIRFPDRVTDDKNLHWVEEDEFGDYRLNWKNWPVLCPREKWEAVKTGQFTDDK